jgi:hypothetical protein
MHEKAVIGYLVETEHFRALFLKMAVKDVADFPTDPEAVLIVSQSIMKYSQNFMGPKLDHAKGILDRICSLGQTCKLCYAA